MKVLPRQTSLRNRFIVGMGVMLLPLVALGVGVFVSLESAISAFEKTEEETLEELFPLTHLESLIAKASVPAKNYLRHGDLAERDRFIRLSREVDSVFMAILMAGSSLPEKRALIQATQKEWQQARMSSEFIFAHPSAARNPKVTQELARLSTHTDQAVKSLDQLYKLLTHLEIADNLVQAQSIKQRVRLINLMVFGLGLGVAVVASLVLARSILLPLRTLEEGVDRLGEGDLSHRINLTTQDELGQLAMTFNLMAEKLEQSQVALKSLASLDGLTGVSNRREFDRRLQVETERSRRYSHSCSLLMLDIDYFKKLNDTYGHQAGDEALRVVASLIKQKIRPIDQVARYGGEEFAIILPETSGNEALAIAERLRRAIANYEIMVAQGQAIHVTISGGVATFPEDAGSEEVLTFTADQSLYVAKHSGRNRVVSSSSASFITSVLGH